MNNKKKAKKTKISVHIIGLFQLFAIIVFLFLNPRCLDDSFIVIYFLIVGVLIVLLSCTRNNRLKGKYILFNIILAFSFYIVLWPGFRIYIGCRAVKCANAICEKCSNPDKNGAVKCTECRHAGDPESTETFECKYHDPDYNTDKVDGLNEEK